MARISLIIFALIFSMLSWADSLDHHFKKAEFKVGRVKIHAYIADTDKKRERGLMYVEKIPDNTGMLFAFNAERTLTFWMKNTLVPLSIGFFDHKGKLIDIQEMKVLSSLLVRDSDIPIYSSRKPAAFALEMNPRWFARHHVKVGTRLKLISKSPSALVKRLSSRR